MLTNLPKNLMTHVLNVLNTNEMTYPKLVKLMF